MNRYFRFLSRTTLAGLATALFVFTSPAPADALDLIVDYGDTFAQSTGTQSYDFEYIGSNSTGTFTHTGGTNYTYELYLGHTSTGNGTYNLSGTGALSTGGGDYIGYAGTGTFTQTGGTYISGNYGIHIGFQAGSNGSYNLSGGTVWSNGVFVGESGTGTFTQTSGTNDISTFGLRLGYEANGNGSYSLSDTGILSTAGTAIGVFGTGTFIQAGGTHTTSGYLNIGDGTLSSGSYSLSAGILSTYAEIIGDHGTGDFVQTGGTHTTDEIILGFWGGSSGSYTLGEGSLSTRLEDLGFGGTGVFTQTGGTHTVTETLNIGNGLPDSGTYNLSAGTLAVQNSTGTASIQNNDTINYAGGTLNADSITNGVGANFNISGPGTRMINSTVTNSDSGTIRSTGTNAVFTGAVYNNGAYISDRSNNYFTELSVSGYGYLTGGFEDSFFVSGDFFSESSQNMLWNTTCAYLNFNTGVDTLHSFSLNGLDMGANALGYADNYAWHTLELEVGNSLAFVDGDLNGGAGLYLSEFLGLNLSGNTITNITGFTGLNVYYDALLGGNTYLNGLDYTFAGGGQLLAMVGATGVDCCAAPVSAPVPEPSTLLLLGSGLAGLGFVRRRFKA